MDRTTAFAIGIMLLVASAASAQQRPPRPVDLADVQIGKAFPYPPFAAGAKDTMGNLLGYYVFDAPNAPDSTLPFSQFQVAVNARSHVVSHVRAMRAYSELKACTAAFRSIAAFVQTRFGIHWEPSGATSVDKTSGDIRVIAGCGYPGQSPYPTLDLQISSVSQAEEFDELRRKRFAR